VTSRTFRTDEMSDGAPVMIRMPLYLRIRLKEVADEEEIPVAAVVRRAVKRDLRNGAVAEAGEVSLVA
jgi:hypothetical protein